jgi:hypothetical protein
MVVNSLSFGSITIDGVPYDKDVIIDHGVIKKRNKSESKAYRSRYGHTPLSSGENIPWDCKKLIIGAGHYSSLPVMDEVYGMAGEKGVELIIVSTPEAVKYLNEKDTNLILHLTC